LREIYDPDFKRLIIKTNKRARHIIFYNKPDGLHITVPPGTGEQEVRAILEKYRQKLLEKRRNEGGASIDLNYQINTPFFKLRLVEGVHERFLLRTQTEFLELVCPSKVNFQDEKLQSWLRKVIEEALRKKPAPCCLVFWKRGLLNSTFLIHRFVLIPAKGVGVAAPVKNILISLIILFYYLHT